MYSILLLFSTMSFDHNSSCYPALPRSNPTFLAYPIYAFLISESSSPICAAFIFMYVAFLWSLIDLPGTTLLKKTDSPILSS